MTHAKNHKTMRKMRFRLTFCIYYTKINQYQLIHALSKQQIWKNLVSLIHCIYYIIYDYQLNQDLIKVQTRKNGFFSAHCLYYTNPEY